MNLIPTALADAPAAAAAAPTSQASPWSTVIMLVVFFAIFYFLLIRPQSKKAKAQRAMLSNLGKGDEVVTASGIMGKITEIQDTSVTVEIASNVNIQLQKGAISSVLPKGSVKL